MPGPAHTHETRRIRIRPDDPFDLIRLLARSQNDPRKAVAELVQNSLDAGATDVTVSRFRRRGTVCLSVLDNGTGVLPEMTRPDALHHLATHVGHSYKKRLTAHERYQLLQIGKYGIGLLGFWAVGKFLSLRSRVAGSEVYALHLEEDEPQASVEPERELKLTEPTWTEALIRGLHAASQRLLSGRRLSEYLGFELRGQLLQREVRLRVVDKLARGRAQQDFPVRAPRFQGVPLSEVREWPVPGHLPLRVELHYLPEEHGPGSVTLGCTGSTVADDLTQLEAVDLRYAPWDSKRLTGLVDAPFLDVAPGTRRGIVPNDKAMAFEAAMRGLAEKVRSWMSTFEQARARDADRALHRRLKDVFRELQRHLPHYELFPVQDGAAPAAQDSVAAGDGALLKLEEAPRVDAGDVQPELYEPGPLAALRVVPGRCRLAVGAEKSLVARAVDASGRVIRSGVSFAWHVEGVGRLLGDAGMAVYHAQSAGTAIVHVEARQAERQAKAQSTISVEETLDAPEREGAGIPEPVEVKDPAARWRSRLKETRWEFNASHPDYLMAAADPARRFRYLVTLLAKELVLRQTAGGPQEDRLLESLVEVLAALEAGLGRGSRKRD